MKPIREWKKLWQYDGWQLNLILFGSGFVDSFFNVLWIACWAAGKIEYASIVAYAWDSTHDFYLALPADQWQNTWRRRCEKFGTALGVYVCGNLFPLHLGGG